MRMCDKNQNTQALANIEKAEIVWKMDYSEKEWT